MTDSPPRPTSQEVPAGYSERLSLLIQKLALELIARAGDGLAGLGLTDRQYLALAVLATDEPGSQHELGKLMGLAPQLVVALTDSLEDRGLVTRRTNPDDRRRTLVELTRAGRRALAQADELTADMEDELFGSLEEDARELLQDLLRHALAAAHSRNAHG